MNAIFRQALGRDFGNLHPQIQKRFGFSSNQATASIGKGVMEQVWNGGHYTTPFLWLGSNRHVMFAETGNDIPFTIENYAYQDSLGRETLTIARTFKFPQTERHFDATMIYSDNRHCIVDYLGTHQHLAVDLEVSVDQETKGIRLRSGEQRFYEGLIGFRFPMNLSAFADVCEWFDDNENCYRIRVEVKNRIFGRIFGYHGRFQAQYLNLSSPAEIPARVKPIREEIRE